MKINTKEALEKFSFIDYKVTSLMIHPKTRAIIINLTGALCLENDILKELNKGYLKVEHFDSIEITSYNAIEKSTTKIEIGKQEQLHQLCEIDFFKDKLIFKGFADKTFNWLEFKIQGGTLEGDFMDM